MFSAPFWGLKLWRVGLTNRVFKQPATSLSDEAIVAALKKVGLWVHFTSGLTSAESRRILEKDMADLPAMSAGQLQLFSLARALIRLEVVNSPSDLSDAALSRPRAKPVLLLDEATSSLDPDTEAVMQSVLHQSFAEQGHTVIAITHRLSGVTENLRPDRDTVVVLSGGMVRMIGKAEDFIGAVSI